MKHIAVPIQRLYNGYIADVRDYIWDRAKRTKRGIKFHVLSTDRWMTVPYAKLDTGEHNARIEKSRYNKPYHLVMFKFTPDAVKRAPEQLSIMKSGAVRLLEAWKESQHENRSQT